MSIDFETRRAVAQWCREVALEDPATTNHAERLAIARTLVLKIMAHDPAQDTLLPNIVGIVRAFAGDDASPATVANTVETILDVYVALGVLQG